MYISISCYNIDVKVKVFAKLNLTLNVGEKSGKFHNIDSVATSVDVYDTVVVAIRNDSQVNVYGVNDVEQQHNTAYKAAVAFRRVFGKSLSKPTCGVDIYIHKGIPYGGGLGGSSADAAAVIYCMCKHFGVDINSRSVRELCAAVGSDVNFMLFGGLGRLTGKGDDVTYYEMTSPLYFALTTFDAGMNSGEIYSAFDNLPQRHASRSGECGVALDVKRTEELLSWLQQGANDKAIALFSNDLQQATLSVSNYARDYLNIVQFNNLKCNMTGSGSAYYVACPTREKVERVANLLNAGGFETTICKSMPHGIEETD